MLWGNYLNISSSKPDIVLRKYKTVIFVNGCFWHGHKNCRYFVIPKSRTNFWVNKIEGTRKRDLKNIQELKDMGWKVITVWECELNKPALEHTIDRVSAEIKSEKVIQ